MFRYESLKEFLATLRQTNHLACFGQWGTESLDDRSKGSDRVVKMGGAHPTVALLIRRKYTAQTKL